MEICLKCLRNIKDTTMFEMHYVTGIEKQLRLVYIAPCRLFKGSWLLLWVRWKTIGEDSYDMKYINSITLDTLSTLNQRKECVQVGRDETQ